MPDGRYIPEKDWPDWQLLLQEFRAVGKTLRKVLRPEVRGGGGRGLRIRFCKPDADIAAGATGIVSLWTGGPGDSGAEDTDRNLTGDDMPYAPIAVSEGEWCTVEKIQGTYYVFRFTCPPEV